MYMKSEGGTLWKSGQEWIVEPNRFPQNRLDVLPLPPSSQGKVGFPVHSATYDPTKETRPRHSEKTRDLQPEQQV